MIIFYVLVCCLCTVCMCVVGEVIQMCPQRSCAHVKARGQYQFLSTLLGEGQKYLSEHGDHAQAGRLAIPRGYPVYFPTQP